MKKYFITFCLVLFLLVGCGNEKTPQEVFEEASQKMEKIDNLTIKMKMEFGIEQDNEIQNVDMNIIAKIDEMSKMTDMDISMDMGGMAFNIKSYTETVDGKNITYTKNLLGEGYTKTTSDIEEDTLDTDEMTDMLDDVNNIKEVESDIKGMKKYEASFSKEDIQKLMEMSGEFTGEENIQIVSDLTIPVYIDNEGYVRKMVMDMTDFIAPVEGMSYTKVAVTFEFSDFNNTTVSIPENVKTSASEEVFDLDI